MSERDLVGREYLRVSYDRSGIGQSPDQQHAENAEEFLTRGWTLHAEPYRDEGSASRYARRERKGFLQLQSDLRSGHFNAEVLVLWESSRGSRTVREWLDLLELCEEYQVRLFVTTHGRLYDPRNGHDRQTLISDANDSEFESSKTSVRLLRSTAASAREGKPHGKNLWGYRRVYDTETRRLIRIEPHPETGPLVTEAARRFLAGASCYGIAKDWNARQIPPRRESFTEHRRGLGWTSKAVRDILSKPSYTGQRTHHGEIVADATWPALIPREDWDRIQTLLRQRSRPADFKVRHLLTGIAFCAICGGPLAMGRQRSGRRADSAGRRLQRPTYLSYVCRGAPGRTKFHVSIKKEFLEQAVVEAVLARLERPDFLALVGQRDHGVDGERAALLEEIARRRAYLEAVRARAADEQRLDLLFDQESKVAPLIKEAEQRLNRLVGVDPALVDLAKSGEARSQWDNLPIESQRTFVRGLVTPTIHRSQRPSGTKRTDLNRIEMIWK